MDIEKALVLSCWLPSGCMAHHRPTGLCPVMSGASPAFRVRADWRVPWQRGVYRSVLKSAHPLFTHFANAICKCSARKLLLLYAQVLELPFVQVCVCGERGSGESLVSEHPYITVVSARDIFTVCLLCARYCVYALPTDMSMCC